MDPLEQAAQRFGQALEQHRAGRLPQAEKLYREALALAPDRISVMVNLAAVLTGQQRFADALRYCERVLALQPTQTDALHNAALCRLQLFADDEALALTERALKLDPHGFAALNNRGVALADRGRVQEALACFDQALSIRPGAIGVRGNRGSALTLLARPQEAMADFVVALRSDPNYLPAQHGLYDLLCSTPAIAAGATAEVEALAIRAMVEPWGRPQGLALPLLAMLRRHAGVASLLARYAEDARDDDDALGPTAWRLLADNATLQALLGHALIPDPALERLLTRLRNELLAAAQRDDDGADIDVHRLSLHCALARQCFLNDYVYPASDDERARAAALRARLKVAATPNPTWIAACASYAPLGIGLDGARLLADPVPAPVAAVMLQQLQEPAQERDLVAAIGSLTPIVDPTSLRVRRQYETHPTPRWAALPARREAHSFAAYMATRIPGVTARELPRATRITALIAGCGTGQDAIETAQGILGIEVLAIDLSRASLAYAKRMAQQLGVGNLRFAQADLLELGGNLRFELIESSGLLHNMGDPLRGLAALVDHLHDGGVMRLGLYSERGRHAIAAARAFIGARGFGSDAAGIRTCRREILALATDAPTRGVTMFSDFYSVGGCRDLMFQEQEHRFDLPAIAAALAPHRLTLLGFELEPARRAEFTRQFPDPAAQRDFAAWHAFEAAHPDAFASMYHFWVRKPG